MLLLTPLPGRFRLVVSAADPSSALFFFHAVTLVHVPPGAFVAIGAAVPATNPTMSSPASSSSSSKFPMNRLLRLDLLPSHPSLLHHNYAASSQPAVSATTKARHKAFEQLCIGSRCDWLFCVSTSIILRLCPFF